MGTHLEKFFFPQDTMMAQQQKNHNYVNGMPESRSSVRHVAYGRREKARERSTSVVIQRNPSQQNEQLLVGTWNVRTMNQAGKLENVKEEMKRNGLRVLGLCEVRWKGGGDFESDGYRVIYSGGNESQRGVAVVLDKETAKRVIEIERISDRLMMVKVQDVRLNMVLIQLHMPTTEHEDDEVDLVYEQLEELLAKQKGTENVVIMGDWNAVVGEAKTEMK